ncbi:MAG: ABC transporter substrate-binding protein [Leptolyngbyaceae cyanobacterium bins.59]|nr:ABC transporter substrate-binding protein [Leptolyngbyaceae cyanobacterium bins.59]
MNSRTGTPQEIPVFFVQGSDRLCPVSNRTIVKQKTGDDETRPTFAFPDFLLSVFRLKDESKSSAFTCFFLPYCFMQRRSPFTLLGLLTCLLAVLIGCAQEPPVPLRVGSNVWPGFESLYLARDLGYYKDPSIQLVSYPSATEVTRAFRNGELEVAALTLDETLALAETEPNIRILLVTDISNGADVILGKPDLKTLQDLKGKRVGVESSALGAYVLSRALDQTKLSPQEIRIVSLGASEHELAFKQGRVDAIVTFDPTRSNLIAGGANLLFDSRQIPGEVVDVLVVRQELLERRHATMKALVEGWFKALDYLAQNPEDASLRMAPRQGVTPKQFLDSLKLLKIPTLLENQQLLSQKDPTLIEGAKRLSRVMVEKQLLKRAIDPTPLLTDQVVQSLK